MSTNLPVRLLIADDHELYRDGLRVMLRKQSAIEVVGEAADGAELVRLAHSLRPAVVLTDVKMPVLDGIGATRQLVKDLPHIPVVALSMFDEENLIVDMLEAGAKGYLLKNAPKEEIVAAVETVYRGELYYCGQTSRKLAKMIANSSFDAAKKSVRPTFSDRELEIIGYVCDQLSNKEIAARLNVSTRTVEGQRERIQDKMGVRNMAGIVVYAIKHKLYEV